MKNFLLVGLLLSSFVSFSQKCNCLKSIQWLENEYETNLASYQDQVIELKQQSAYQKHKLFINQLAKKIITTKDCIGLVALYQSFFKDNHLFINYNNPNNLSDSSLFRELFPNETYLNITQTKTINRKLEGLWYFQDGSFNLKIIPSKSYNRNWAGIFIQDYNTNWFKGQIKMEFKENTDSTFGCLYWYSDKTPKYFKAILTDSILYIGRTFKFYRKKEKALTAKSTLPYELEFKQLSDKTNYLRVPSFELSNHDFIDSIVKANLKNIQSKPNLIIDLRNNGGGGDQSFQCLLPIVFENKIIYSEEAASVWTSKNNFKWYDSTKFDYAKTLADSLDECNFIEGVKPYIGKFTPYFFEKDTLDTIYNSPKKVALITNKWCGSSTEAFILLAKQNNKVTLFGENTGGMLSYGDWRKIEVPGLPIWVTCTTKKIRFRTNKNIEDIGIKPNVLLNPENENNWIEEVKQQMEK